MKRITSTKLAAWAPENDCRENFGLLIRRLIWASPIKVIKMLFPAGDNVNLPGFDGILQVSGSYLYIPDGESVWEWGASKDYEGKANEEYKKRTYVLTKKEKSTLTFVFVTPYVWSDKGDWVKTKKKEKAWKDIRVIDGLILEEWIERLPAVSSWLAKFLNLPQGNALPLDRFW